MIAMTLDDLHELFWRYVPIESRHSSARDAPPESWWPAHELGHLLTVPKEYVGLPMFGIDDEADPGGVNEFERRCLELAAMSVSGRLLRAVGRADLARSEIDETDEETIDFAYDNPRAKARVRVILRERRVARMQPGRRWLESQLRRALSDAGFCPWTRQRRRA